jgi:hypothetical protein
VIKGTFKDHLVDWVGEYLETVHGKMRAKEILADIDLQHVVCCLPSVNMLTFH